MMTAVIKYNANVDNLTPDIEVFTETSLGFLFPFLSKHWSWQKKIKFLEGPSLARLFS